MTATYEKIATTTLGSNQGTVTFSSIPQTYTDLILIGSTQDTRSNGNDFDIYFNNDLTSNYSQTNLVGNGSSATSSRSSQEIINLGPNVGSNQGYYNAIIAHIMNYTNTTTYKTVLSRGNHPGSATVATVGMWRSTSAITRIDAFPGYTYSFTTGSTFTLYGIKAA